MIRRLYIICHLKNIMGNSSSIVLRHCKKCDMQLGIMEHYYCAHCGVNLCFNCFTAHKCKESKKHLLMILNNEVKNAKEEKRTKKHKTKRRK
jgi:hypothetical protein